MDSFNGALIQPDKSISSDVKNSLIITSNYNLLDDDNISVSWSDNTVSVKRPSGLSNLSKIRYRNFKGSMLPFTTIDLPNLNVEVIVTGNGVDSGVIEGADGPWPERFEYKLGQKNVLLSFNKAWTYDSNADDQLKYNIEEAVREVNRRLLERYPIIRYDKIYGLEETYFEGMTQRIYYTNSIRPISINMGSYLIGVPANASLNNMGMIYTDGLNELTVNFKYDDRRPFYISCSYDMKIILGCLEFPTGTIHGRHLAWKNSSSTTIPSYYGYVIVRDDAVDTRENIFGVFPNSPSGIIAQVNGLTSVILSPITKGIGKYDKNVIVSKGTFSNSYYHIDFDTNITVDGRLACIAAGDAYDTVGNSKNLLYMLCAYRDKDIGFGFNVGLFTFDISTLSTTRSKPTVVTSPRAHTATYDENSFTDYQKAMTCGKEIYRVIEGEYGGFTYIWFLGAYLIKLIEGDIIDYVLLPCWKISENQYLSLTVKGDYQLLDLSLYDSDGIINLMVNFFDNRGFNIFNYSKLHMSSMSPPYMIKQLSEGTVVGLVQNPNWLEMNIPNYSYYFNESHLNNALMCDIEGEFNMLSTVTVKNIEYNIQHSIDNHPISVSTDFFQFLSDGTLMTSQILYENGYSLCMSLNIYTDPYYFSFRSPINYFTGFDSIIHPIVEPFFSTLNDHVLNTINILILMKYEFNDIELTCNNFPNNNGVIFHLNEESQVEFKEMMTDNTQDEIKLQLISKNEPLTLSLLKSLYGNISISLDWVCF